MHVDPTTKWWNQLNYDIMAKFVALIAIVIMAMVVGMAKAITLCNVTQDGMAACRPSVVMSNPTLPSLECCNAVSVADITCLCSYRNSSMLPLLGIDRLLTLGLLAKCHLPSPTTC